MLLLHYNPKKPYEEYMYGFSSCFLNDCVKMN